MKSAFLFLVLLVSGSAFAEELTLAQYQERALAQVADKAPQTWMLQLGSPSQQAKCESHSLSASAACMRGELPARPAPAAVVKAPAETRCPQAGPALCKPLPRKDPLTNPDAVKHRIDRSAMEIPIQGWSRDLKYPVYPIQVQSGANATYYITNEHVKQYKEFDFDELRCEIGDADKAVLKAKDYLCSDGVCMTKEGAILGTDPRRPVNKKHRCQ